MKLIRPIAITDADLTSSNVLENDYAVYSATVAYALADRVISTSAHKVYESLTATTQTGTATMTIASPCVVTWPSGTAPVAGTMCSFTTTGALPTGLSVGALYYVLAPVGAASNLALTAGGAAINTSGSQSGVHTVTASANAGRALTNTIYWLEVSSTNRWKMFDASVQSQTTRTDNIAVTITPGERTNAIALFNLDAASLAITVTDPTEGLVYSASASLVSPSGITDWYAYFFEPIVRKDTYIATDLPPYSAGVIAVTLTGTSGETVGCGELVLGLSRDLGDVQYGAELGITDYSVKAQDAFGNYEITERAFSRRASYQVWVENVFVDELIQLLSEHRATPVVYQGSADFAASAVYGFYKDFTVAIAYPAVSLCSIEIEGLT